MAQQTLGIIGDGQLGMMLCNAASALDIRTVMLAGSRQGAGATSAAEVIEGAMDDADAIASLITKCDVITFEREDIPASTIAHLRAAEGRGDVSCFPPLNVIELIQDKARQKRWLTENHIPTLPFFIVDGTSDAFDAAGEALGFPLIQKALRGGFDGRGVQLLRSKEDKTKAWPGETLLEQYAGEFREIAVLLVRDRDGSCRHFGPVDMTFESDYSVLDTVTAPADVNATVEDAAITLAKDTITAMHGVGVFGVELFLLTGDRLVINEISPRVHNAGHYTIEACDSSQFEQHLRAVLGMAPVATTQRQPAAMRNLLCTAALQNEGQTRAPQVVSRAADVTTHWYGKSPARLMRKLGHVTALGASPCEALAKAVEEWNAIECTAGANARDIPTSTAREGYQT